MDFPPAPSLPPSLQRLRLSAPYPSAPPAITTCTRLLALELQCSECEPVEMKRLRRLRRLTELVVDCSAVDEAEARRSKSDYSSDCDQDPRIEPYEAELPELAGLAALRRLSLAHVRGLYGQEEWLPALRALTRLDIAFCMMWEFPVQVSGLTGGQCFSAANLPAACICGALHLRRALLQPPEPKFAALRALCKPAPSLQQLL